MKKKLSLCLVMALSLSLWAAGARHDSAFIDISTGWHGSLQFDSLFNSHRVITVGSMTTEGVDDVLAAMNISEGFKFRVTEGISSVALGIGVRQMHWEKLGWASNLSFLIPCKTSHTLHASSGKDSAREKFSFGLDDFQSFWGLDYIAGMVFMPIRNYRWGLSLTHGLHIGSVSIAITGVNFYQIVLGLATEITVDFYFSKNFYLNGGVALTYDFYSFGNSSIKSARGGWIHDDWHGATTYISCRPKIAIGYKMM